MADCFKLCCYKDLHYMCVLSVVKCDENFVQGSLSLGHEEPNNCGEVRWNSNKEIPQK